MVDLITLDEQYSTTRRVLRADPSVIAEAVRQSLKPEDKFDIVLFLPESEGRQGDGGLRKKNYFKKSSDDKPLITVVTVVYNGEQFLEESILSVINQTYDNVEYIVIDGGSTDGTLDIIKKYEHAIDYWVSEKDKGIYDAMNKGISLATGEWVNFMNGGDSFYSSTVFNDIFSNNLFSDVTVLYGNHQVIYPGGRTRFAKSGLIENMWKGSQFCHQASFIKVSYHKNNIYNIHTKIVGDFEFFYKTWRNGRQFKFVDVVLAKFESGGVSDTNRIHSILGRWIIVEKTFRNNLFYCYIVMKESFKEKVKHFFKL